MNDIKINLQSMLYSYYIKYDRMFELAELCFANANDNRLDIYVDLHDMLKAIYSRAVYADKQFIIVSSVINLAAHLRGFFWSRYRVQTRIYLVYGTDETNNHKQFYQNFGYDNTKDMIDYDKNKFFIESQLDLMKILVAYIEGVYYIKRQTNFAMFVYDNIVKNPGITPLIISKSKYSYQLPAFIDNCILFRPMKSNGEDTSYAVTHSTVLNNFFGTKNDKSKELLDEINPRLIGMLVALNGAASCGIKAACNINVATRAIHKAITTNLILNDYISDPEFLYPKLDIDKYIDPMSFKYRFNAFDLIFQHRIYNSSAEARDITWLVDLHDPETVKSIANRYFIDNPLDLNNL